MMTKKKFLTIRIDDDFKGNLDWVHNDLNHFLPCGVSQTYAVRLLLTMGLDAYKNEEGFLKRRAA